MNPRILLIMPTRGRQVSALKAVISVLETAVRPDLLQIVVCVDADEDRAVRIWQKSVQTVCFPGRTRFVEWINSMTSLNAKHFGWIGWLGDDVRFATPGWDELVRSSRSVVVYGQDGYLNRPSHPFIRSVFPVALGYMIPNTLTHYGPDAFVGAVAAKIPSLEFDPRISTQHLHPDAGRAVEDQTYSEARQFWDQDIREWERIQGSGIIEEAAAKIRMAHEQTDCA